MSSGNKLFSICIPTNNRVQSLRETLEDLIPKIQTYKVKIFIHDNNSSDGTELYVSTLQKRYPYIQYKRSNLYNESDRNMTTVLKMSDTKYRLLLGDHYILIDDTVIDKIYTYISSDMDFDALILCYKNRLFFKNKDYLYTDKNEFLEELGWYIGMTATTIYSDKMVSDLKFEKYFDTNFTQSLSVLDYIAETDFKIQFIEKDLVWSTKGGVKGKSSWHDRVLEIFGRDWYQGIMSLSNVYSMESKLKCIKNHAKMTTGFYSFKSFILYRYAGGLTVRLLFKYIKCLYYTTNLKTVCLAFFVSLIPTVAIKYIFKNEWEYIQRVLGKMDKYQSTLS